MIDVAIALGMVYLMLAGLVSGVHELVATAFQMRGRMLLKGVESLLCGATSAVKNAPPLMDELMAHPMIDVLRDRQRRPSYVPAGHFSVALADTLVRTYGIGKPLFSGLPEAVGRLPDGKFKQSLSLLVAQAAGDPDKLRALVEAHFDAVMDRVSGWYKRRSHLVILIIAAVVTVGMNVDSIAIVQRLARDDVVRETLVAEAKKIVVDQGAPTGTSGAATSPSADATGSDEAALQRTGKALSDVKQRFLDAEGLGLPIGWSVNKASGTLQLGSDQSLYKGWNWPIAIVGWLISALAASLGAPFWFDAISKLVSLRGSGGRPESPGGPTAGSGAPPSAPVVIQVPPSAPAATTAATTPLNDFEQAHLNDVDIAQLQRMLGMAAGDITGEIDEPTRVALRKWQYDRGYDVTGAFDEPTVMAVLYPQG